MNILSEKPFDPIFRWVSKMVKKKFKSTVLCCAFHPHNGQLLATGSADFKCRVFSTFDSTVDAAPSQGYFEKPLEFGEAYCEMSSSGWINSVAWSPSGDSLCYSGKHSLRIEYIFLWLIALHCIGSQVMILPLVLSLSLLEVATSNRLSDSETYP